MAETYGIYDWRQLPRVTAATLAQGPPASSRTTQKLTGTKITDDRTVLLAIIADRVGHIAWMFSKDGEAGKNHPQSIFELVTGTAMPETGFDSEEDFTAAWAAITGTGGEADA